MSEEWIKFDYKNKEKIKKLKGKYLAETLDGNTWVVDFNKDNSGYPHKCSCGMNAAMSMHFTKYRPLPNPLAKSDYETYVESHDKLVKQIDVILNGKNAAVQASLCDLVGQIKEVNQREAELYSYIEARDSEEMVERVAKAIYETLPVQEERRRPSTLSSSSYKKFLYDWSWEECKQDEVNYSNLMRQKARAAIKAMEGGG